MKLNYKRTFLIGLAFLSISAFWQMYDGVIPKILTKTFHMRESLSGAIMALDNVLALFLLPFFGGLSDKTSTRLGRRTPYILFGTGCAVVLMNVLPLIDNSYAALAGPGKLIAFIGVLLLLLLAMSTYRSPAVALMPDVTPKPLRSKANAVINLMGAVGGMTYLVLSNVLYSGTVADGVHVNYQALFALVSGIMLLAVSVMFATVREPKLAAENAKYEAAHPEENLAVTDEKGNEVLPKPVKQSLLFLLMSVSLWYIAYNGVTTWFTTYADVQWHMALGTANLYLTVGTAAAIVSYIPAGFAASRFGRKKTILGGVVMIALGFASAFLYTMLSDGSSGLLIYPIFVLIGMGWATINVNSLPMVVEMCKESDLGKFTGYYYAFSMAAQVVTPIVAGWLLEHVSYNALFPYATIAAICAFITMSQVRHGDSKGEAKRGLDAFEEME